MYSKLTPKYNYKPVRMHGLPTSISNMFGNRSSGITKKIKARIGIVISTLCWSIWNCRNNHIFDRTSNFMFCRLAIWLSIGFSYGRLSSHRISRILLTTECPGLLMVNRESSARFGGSIGWLQDAYLLYIVFRWLIHISTSCDPWFV